MGRNARQLVLWAQCGSTRSLMAPSQVVRRCCLPHLRGICPAKEHLRAWAEAMRRRYPRRFPVRRSAVNGMGTPHGADTTETVLHVDAAARLPDAGMPSQEGHHIRGGVEGHARYKWIEWASKHNRCGNRKPQPPDWQKAVRGRTLAGIKPSTLI